MIVLFDMDDVLVNLNEAWLNHLNSTYDLHVNHEDVYDWNMGLAFPSLTMNQIFSCLHEHDFWWNVSPFTYAKELLQKCEENKDIEYYIVTAATPKNFYLKYECCFKRHFPFVSSERLICCNNKNLIDCDIIVDDNPDNFPKNNSSKKPIRVLMNKPWNKNANPKEYEYRVGSLEFVDKIITEYIDFGGMKK